MHQVVPALAALTFACLVGCGGASSLPSTAGTTAPPPTATTFSPTDTPSTTEPGATPSTAAPHAAATPGPVDTPCPPARDRYTGDLIVWTEYGSDVQPSASLLGSYDGGPCPSTLDFLRTTSPVTEGACTLVALPSDNPGYNVDDTPAPRPKHTILAVGPAC